MWLSFPWTRWKPPNRLNISSASSQQFSCSFLFYLFSVLNSECTRPIALMVRATGPAHNGTWHCSPSQLNPVQGRSFTSKYPVCSILFTQQYLSSLSHTLSLGLTPPPNHPSNNYTFFCPFHFSSEWLSHCMLRLPVACGDSRECVMTAPLPQKLPWISTPRSKSRSCIHSASMHMSFLGLMESWILFTFLIATWQPVDFPADSELSEGKKVHIMH